MVAEAISDGTTIFSASFSGVSGSGELTVAAQDCGDEKPDSIIIVEGKAVEIGDTVQFTAKGFYADGCEQDLTNDHATVFQSRDRDICRFESP